MLVTCKILTQVILIFTILTVVVGITFTREHGRVDRVVCACSVIEAWVAGAAANVQTAINADVVLEARANETRALDIHTMAVIGAICQTVVCAQIRTY